MSLKGYKHNNKVIDKLIISLYNHKDIDKVISILIIESLGH